MMTTTPRPHVSDRQAGRPTGRATAARGFTLIEVLIATVLLALGALSLLVLFAGAATQQRIASETTRALLASKSAEAVIAPRFSRVQGDDLGAIATNEWFPLPLRISAADGQRILTVDPEERGDLYFVVPEEGVTTLYEYVGVESSPGPALRAGRFNHSSSPQSPTPQPVPEGSDDSVFIQDAGGGTTLFDFGHGRLDPDNIGEIVVEFAQRVPNSSPVEYSTQFPLRYQRVIEGTDINSPDIPPNPPLPGGFELNPNDDRLLFTRTGNFSDTDYIVIDTNGGSPPNELFDAQNARIEQFSIEPVHQARVNAADRLDRYITRISVEGYAWRSDRVAGTEERIVRDDQDRPKLGYTVLFRSGQTGAGQIAVYSYLIRGGGDDTEFSPNEDVGFEDGFYRDPNREHPLQRVNVTLEYDDELNRHFITPDDRDDSFVTEIGQSLLVARGPTFDMGGSDVKVDVIAQRTIDGERRGYLDRVPRFNNRTMLEDRNGSQRLEVYAIQDSIRDLNGRTWRLEPGGVRIFQLN